MRGFIGTILILSGTIWSVSFCATEQVLGTASGIRFRSTVPGIAVFQGSIVAAGRTVSLTAVRVSVRSRRLEVAIPPKGQDGDTLIGFEKRYEAQAVLSGGFLKSFFPPIPLGFVKHQGIVENRGSSGDLLTGLLVAVPRRVAIIPYSGQANANWEEGLQAGPLLVNERRSGLPDNSASLSRSTRALIDQNYLRAFVAVLPDGDVILGTTGEVSLIGLVEFLTRSVDRGGLESLAALNLSGADSIGLRVKTASSTISVGRQDVFLANSIIVH